MAIIKSHINRAPATTSATSATSTPVRCGFVCVPIWNDMACCCPRKIYMRICQSGNATLAAGGFGTETKVGLWRAQSIPFDWVKN